MHDAHSTGCSPHGAWFALVLTLLAGCSRPADPSPDATGSAANASYSTESDAAAEAKAAKSRERAVAITNRMLDVYRGASSYTDHAAYVEESVLRGEGVAHEIPYYEISIAFRRPNQLRLRFTEAIADAGGDRRGFDIACDGALLRATMPEIPDQIVEKPAPAALTADNVLTDPLISEKLFERKLGDVFPQLAMLLNLSDDDAAAVYPHDSNPRLLANQQLDGHDCYRVATTHHEGTRVFWIDATTYALRRMELPVELHRQRIDPDRHFLRLSVRIDFQDATFDAEIDPASFELKPPADARRVRRFVLPEDASTAKDAEDDAADEESTAKDATEEDPENGGD